ncbi:hypothetical protein BOTBODRAFT_59103 [Botryobasidium botryosum FD-172 SS1]|uniref:Calcineurin-like phosphoesterase domain-containing protein n=1 Tax=Botryobasidium botryosum (strain FD-172 SS1) TaxID=930990 RepID=A0A067M064_BOTB1|nr:hypothetical protein BOTBODRAFT_59103 [Botryobasidium botryosum FD-172 SS1]
MLTGAVVLSLLSLAWLSQGFPTALNPLNPYPDKPRVTFKPDGSFTLSVFSDLHFGENPWDTWGPEQDRKSLVIMRDVLSREKPDYIVLNGDQITGENTFKENSTTLVNILTQPIRDAKIPFSSTYGNHDNQVNITHLAELEQELKIAPTSYTRRSPPGVGGPGGEANYWVPIYAKSTDAAPSLIFWFFDSRGGISTEGKALPDWVDESVAQWIESETAVMEKAWGPAENRAAMVFVHIPPHVMESLQKTLNSAKEPGLNADPLGVGSTQSSESTSGGQDLDLPFWNTVNSKIKNLLAVVSGHDHGNEWCKRDPAKDVVLCFDKHSGYGGYSKGGWGYGTRTFQFSLKTLKSSVTSWVRMEDGSKKDQVTLDKNYSR